MVCQSCGKEMVKIGELTKKEQEEFWFINEKINCAYQALNTDVIKDMKFSDGQVFEYFRAAYDSLAQAKFLHFVFFRDLKKRFDVGVDIFIDEISCEVFVHPSEEK